MQKVVDRGSLVARDAGFLFIVSCQKKWPLSADGQGPEARNRLGSCPMAPAKMEFQPS
jgi:hypothetical protein